MRGHFFGGCTPNGIDSKIVLSELCTSQFEQCPSLPGQPLGISISLKIIGKFSGVGMKEVGNVQAPG